MNVFNRIVTILVILAAMIVIPLTLMFPEQTQFVLRGAADIIQVNIDWLDSLSTAAQIGMRVVLSAIGMIAFVIGLLLLILEAIRLRRSTVRLKDGSGELMMDGIAGHLAYYVDLLPDVLRVKPTVQSTGKSVLATLNVETAPGVNILEKSNEIVQTAHHVLEDELGLQVKGQVKVVIKPVPYPKPRPSTRKLPDDSARAAPEPQPQKAPPSVETAPEEISLESLEPAPGSALEDGEVIDVKAPPEPGG